MIGSFVLRNRGTDTRNTRIQLLRLELDLREDIGREAQGSEDGRSRPETASPRLTMPGASHVISIWISLIFG
jgi:hypothetical protein